MARLLLESLGLESGGATLTSCPTCGGCWVAMIPIAERVEQRLSTVKGEVSVAVMGCEVNGPGGVGLLFKAGQVKRMKADRPKDAVVDEALRIATERAPVDVKKGPGSVPLLRYRSSF